MRRRTAARSALVTLAAMASAAILACSPAAAPSPTAAPAKPTEAAKSAAPASPAASPAAAGSPGPAASPAAAPKPSAAAPAVDPGLASVWQGKNVSILVGFVAGGGNDAWARLFARHLSKYLPGSPNVIVENMPGAGGVVQANAVYAAKPDGLTIGIYERGIPTFQIRGAEGVRFDVTKLNWLASATTEQFMLVLSKNAGITDARQLPGKPVTIGSTEAGTIGHNWMLVMREALNWQVRHVFGYQGQREVVLAIDRGEVDGIAIATSSIVLQKKDDLEAKTLLALAQIGGRSEDKLFAGVPTATDLLKDASAEHKTMMDFVEKPLNWSRSFAVPPGVDPKVVATMRGAFMQTMADKDFLSDAAQLKFDVIPVPGEQVQQLMEEYMKTPKAIVDRLDKMVEADLPG